MKKILSILLSRKFYGKERANIEVYHLLQESGCYDVTVVINSNSDPRIKENLQGIKIICLDYPDRHDRSSGILSLSKQLIFANIQMRKIIKSVSPDILFVNDEITIYDLYPSLNTFKSKILYRIGDAPAYPKLRMQKLNSWMWKKFSVEKVTRFVYNANYVKRTLEVTGRNTSNDRLIYNYPPKRIFKGKKEYDIYQIYKNGYISFGYIGQIREEKGVLMIINNAIKLTKKGYECQFLFAGSLEHDVEFSRKLKEMVKQYDNIHLLGEIEDIETFFNYVDVLCIPSLKEEPLANTLTEAKYFSVPSIIFPSGGLPELVTHLEDGYVCADKSEYALEQGLEFFISQKTELKTYKQNAKESIYKYHVDRNSFTRKWLEALNTL